MGGDGLRVYIVGDDEVHRALGMAAVRASAGRLAARAGADWFEVDEQVRWCALPGATAGPDGRWFTRTKDVDRPRLNPRVRGRPVPPHVGRLRRALVACAREDPSAALIVLLQDTDGDGAKTTRAVELLHLLAQDAQPGMPPHAIGSAHPEGEAWLLAVRALDPAASARRDDVVRVLGFDPTRQPERLSSASDRPSDAKRVVRFVLLGEGAQLGAAASVAPPSEAADTLARMVFAELEHARSYERCGLGAFVTAVEATARVALADHLPDSRPGP